MASSSISETYHDSAKPATRLLPIGALKRTRAWGAVAKADSPEAAMGALRRLNGLSEDEARRTIAQVKASGENVRWNRGGGASLDSIRAEAQSPNATRGTLRSKGSTSEGRKAIQTPEGVTWEADFLDEGRYGETTESGRIKINKMIDDLVVRDLARTDPEDLWNLIRTVRHEWVHSRLTPYRGVYTEDLGPIKRWIRGQRWGLYEKNQFARYLEEMAAETYGSGSLKEGLRYPLERNYGLTPWGIAKDGGKLGLGVGAFGLGLGATAYGSGTLAKSYDDRR